MYNCPVILRKTAGMANTYRCSVNPDDILTPHRKCRFYPKTICQSEHNGPAGRQGFVKNLVVQELSLHHKIFPHR